MNFAPILPSVVGTLLTAGALTLLAWIFPSTRWTRQLKRDITILGGLQDGPEREAWQKNVDALARRLRAYEKFVPLWQRVVPFALTAFWGVLVTLFILVPENRDAAFAEMPAFIMGIGGLMLTIVYFVIAIRGGDMGGRDPDVMLDKEEGREPNQSR